jgi:baseplate J-like protein|nr:MAG TPA: Baseplate wedge protein [Caudoviricetes sp.]
MDFGVTEKGFVLKSFTDIMKDIENRYKARLQDNNYVLDFNTPEGIHSEAIGYELSQIWEELIEFNNQMNLNTATGIYLDFFGTLLRTPRKAGAYATGQVKITGEKNRVIPAQTIIKYAEKEYRLLSNVALDKLDNNEYYGIGFIQALEIGEESNIASDVAFTTEYEGVAKIINDADVNGGTDDESDSLYRARLKRKQTIEQTATHSALYNGLMALENVKNVLILDPETEPATEAGTIKIFLEGTPDDKIFETILDLKADGILTLGENEAEIFEKKITREGFSRKITYNLLKYSTLQIKVEVVKVKNEAEKDNRYTPLIKQEILNYINNLETGEGASYLKVYSEILGIDDIRKIRLKMGTIESNIREQEFTKIFDIPLGQKFKINENNIEVFYVSE